MLGYQGIVIEGDTDTLESPSMLLTDCGNIKRLYLSKSVPWDIPSS